MTSVTESDKKLWAAYGNKLMSQVMGSSQLGPGDRFYLAPLSAVGIAAGKNINEPIKNQGVFQVSDTLLELNTPVFMPTRKSYFDRALLYVDSVELFSDNNPGAVIRYNDAQEAARKAQKAAQDARKEAKEAWLTDKANGSIDPTMSFELFCATHVPNLAQLERTASGASAKASQAASAIAGPSAAQVSNYLNNLNLANNAGDMPGFNMKCSPQSANQIAADQKNNDAGSYFSPRYDISSQYSGNVDGWIATYAQKRRDGQIIKISFDTKNSENSNFTALGFDEKKVSVTGSYAIFFKATFTHENKTVTKEISSSEAASGLEVTVTATDIGTFKVNPGQKWNPASLFGMPLVDRADPSLRTDIAFVNQVVLGYGVGMSLKMSSSLETQIHNYLEKASSTGGSASFFGYNIGLGGSVEVTNSSTVTFDEVKKASSGGTIDLPPNDNGYPTLLAVIGTQLPSPPPPNIVPS